MASMFSLGYIYCKYVAFTRGILDYNVKGSQTWRSLVVDDNMQRKTRLVDRVYKQPNCHKLALRCDTIYHCAALPASRQHAMQAVEVWLRQASPK